MTDNELRDEYEVKECPACHKHHFTVCIGCITGNSIVCDNVKLDGIPTIVELDDYGLKWTPTNKKHEDVNCTY